MLGLFLESSSKSENSDNGQRCKRVCKGLQTITVLGEFEFIIELEFSYNCGIP